MKEVVVVQACRTAIGDFGGGLKNVSPIEWEPRYCARYWTEVAYRRQTFSM